MFPRLSAPANEPRRSFPAARVVLFVQGAYYVVTGLWPVIHISTAMAAAAVRMDGGLVNIAGGLIAVLGCALLGMAVRARVPIASVPIAAGVAIIAVDVLFAGRGIFPTVYLMDSIVQTAFMSWWALGGTRPAPLVPRLLPIDATAPPAMRPS